MTLMAHNRSHDLVHLPKSFQLNCHHQMGDFMTNKSILVIKLFIFQTVGYLYPICPNIGKARGAKVPPKLGVPGVFCIYDNSPL